MCVSSPLHFQGHHVGSWDSAMIRCTYPMDAGKLQTGLVLFFCCYRHKNVMYKMLLLQIKFSNVLSVYSLCCEQHENWENIIPVFEDSFSSEKLIMSLMKWSSNTCSHFTFFMPLTKMKISINKYVRKTLIHQ